MRLNSKTRILLTIPFTASSLLAMDTVIVDKLESNKHETIAQNNILRSHDQNAVHAIPRQQIVKKQTSPLFTLIQVKKNKFEILANALENGLFCKILKQAPHVRFGKLNPVYNETFKDSIELFNNKFVNFPNFDGSFNEALAATIKILTNCTAEEKLSIAKSFRHLYVPTHIHSKGINQLGDYISEYILTKLIREITDPEMLSNVFYELSQTYSHLLEDSFEKVVWKNDETGCLAAYGLNHIGVNYSSLVELKLTLLKSAIKCNPNHRDAWIRLIEFLIYDNQDSQLTPAEILALGKKWTEHLSGSYCSEYKKPYITGVFSDNIRKLKEISPKELQEKNTGLKRKAEEEPEESKDNKRLRTSC